MYAVGQPGAGRDRHQDRLVDVPVVDARAGLGVDGVVRDDVAGVTEDPLGQVHHRRPVEHRGKPRAAAEHLVAVQPGRVARGAGRLVGYSTPSRSAPASPAPRRPGKTTQPPRAKSRAHPSRTASLVTCALLGRAN
jgi:hypothetical protein